MRDTMAHAKMGGPVNAAPHVWAGAGVDANPYRPWQARITSIIDLTDKEKLFEFRLIDEDVREAFKFDAGQFVELSIFGVGEAPISISSAPSKQGFIELCVRDSGDVTGALHAKQCGDVVGLRGPFGTSWPVEDLTGKDVFIATGGIGLPPLRPAIYHIIRNREKYGKVTLLYGARTSGDLMFPHEYEQWRKAGIDVEVTVDRGDANCR